MHNTTVVPFPASISAYAVVVAFDVGMDELHYHARFLDQVVEDMLPNNTRSIEGGLLALQDKARRAGCNQLVVTVEPTGIYHQLLLDTALRLGMKTAFVNAEVVAKLRMLESNDLNKTDIKDPRVIALVSSLGKTIKHRVLQEPHELMRHYHKLYNKAEVAAVESKCAIHKHLKTLFPDFGFKKEFTFGKSGRALLKGFGFNPYTIVQAGQSVFAAEMKKLAPKIQHKSINQLFIQAQASAARPIPQRVHQVYELALRQSFEDLVINENRKSETKNALEQLYDEVRALDPKLPPPQPGVVAKLSLARFIAETGPLSDFESHRQLLRFIGLNLVERQSGKFRGRTKIAKKGRTLARKVADQIVLPLVKRDRLFGTEYHRMRDVQKMPGTKAMTAMARKFVKLLFGWYKSGRAFDVSRVHTCQSKMPKAA